MKPWYSQSYLLPGSSFFSRVGIIFNATVNKIFSYGYTDFFEIILLLILFGFVAGFFLYIMRNMRK